MVHVKWTIVRKSLCTKASFGKLRGRPPCTWRKREMRGSIRSMSSGLSWTRRKGRHAVGFSSKHWRTTSNAKGHHKGQIGIEVCPLESVLICDGSGRSIPVVRLVWDQVDRVRFSAPRHVDRIGPCERDTARRPTHL